MQGKSNLFIFVTSNVADVYVNVIRHCIEHLDIHENIYFVCLYEDKDKKGYFEQYLKNIITNIELQLDNLSQGKYYNKSQLQEIIVDDYQKIKYALVRNNFKFQSYPILYSNLELELSNILNPNTIIDVSGFQKDYLVDVYSLLHILANTNMFYFKIKTLKNRTYDDKELIHNLHYTKDYEYENISDSIFTKQTVVIRRDENYVRLEQIESIKTTLANKFSSILINLIRVLCVLVSICAIYYFYSHIEKWDKLEPLTFVLFGPFAGWLLNGVYGLFTGKSIENFSLNNIKNYLNNKILHKIKIE